MSEVLATYLFTYLSDTHSYSVTCSNKASNPTVANIPSIGNDGENGEWPVTSIGDRAFGMCSALTSVTIPDSVTCIEYSAFEDCISLTSVTIGNGVTSIDESAFMGCHSLINVCLLNTSPPNLADDVFIGTSSDIKFYCRYSSLSAYKGATDWEDYADKFFADDTRINFIINANATKKFVKQNSSLVHTHHFDIIMNRIDFPSPLQLLIPDEAIIAINVNAISSSGIPFTTLGDLDGNGYIISAFGTIVGSSPVTHVFELKIFYKALNTLLLNIHDLSNYTVIAVAINTVSGGQNPTTWAIQDSVSKI